MSYFRTVDLLMKRLMESLKLPPERVVLAGGLAALRYLRYAHPGLVPPKGVVPDGPWQGTDADIWIFRQDDGWHIDECFVQPATELGLVLTERYFNAYDDPPGTEVSRDKRLEATVILKFDAPNGGPPIDVILLDEGTYATPRELLDNFDAWPAQIAMTATGDFIVQRKALVSYHARAFPELESEARTMKYQARFPTFEVTAAATGEDHEETRPDPGEGSHHSAA